MPYDTTLAALSEGYSKILELDLAEALLDQITKSPQKYIHSFNALLAACDVMVNWPFKYLKCLIIIVRYVMLPKLARLHGYICLFWILLLIVKFSILSSFDCAHAHNN